MIVARVRDDRGAIERLLIAVDAILPVARAEMGSYQVMLDLAAAVAEYRGSKIDPS